MAAATSQQNVAFQRKVIESTYDFLMNGMNRVPFGTLYTVDGADAGRFRLGKAKATVGGHFALMAIREGFWYV
jgi:hypothetical protein